MELGNRDNKHIRNLRDILRKTKIMKNMILGWKIRPSANSSQVEVYIEGEGS